MRERTWRWPGLLCECKINIVAQPGQSTPRLGDQFTRVLSLATRACDTVRRYRVPPDQSPQRRSV